MKKVLSFVLTLTMLASLIAGFGTLNVSAHQNHKMTMITFDELSETNPTGYLYGTGNNTTTDGTYKDMASISSDGARFSSGFNCNQWHYADVAAAPDDRYGKSLLISEKYGEGATTVYAQSPLTPNNDLNGTINVKASLYTEKNSNDLYIQRAIKLRSTVPSPLDTTYREQYAVLFSHEASKGISVFGQSTGRTFIADTWYDMDITYNIETNQFHVIILEDGKDFVDMTGTSTGKLLGNVDTVYLYHSPASDIRNNQKIYWDNLQVQSVNNFKISADSLYPVMDFENLKDQEAGKGFAEGLPSTYTYGFGYQSNPELSVLKALETNKGVSACVYGTPYPGAENTSMTVQRYEYPQLNISGYSLPQFHLKGSVKFENTKLCGIYLNGQSAAEIMFYDNITAFGQTLFTGYDKTGDVWYDIDLIMDTETGYYDLTIVKTDDNTTKHISGFQTKYQTPITTVKFGHDRGSGTAATFVNESFYYIDNLYIGNYTVEDVGSEYTHDFEDTKYPGGYSVTYEGIKMDSLSATAGEFGNLNAESQTDEEGKEVKAEDSFAIPFIQDKPKYTITAKFKLEDLNSNKIVYFGNLPILEILPTGQVKCNQSARPKTEGFLVVGNEYTITHTMQAGCTISSTNVKGVMDVNGTIKESSAGYGSGRPSGPWDPFKIYVKPTGDAEKTSTLTLTDINIDVDYATSSTKNFRIESMTNASPKASIFLPHDKASSGYIFEADLCFDNFDAERTIKIGDTAVATIGTIGDLTLGEEMATLEAGKVYKLTINASHGETSTAVVSLGGVSANVNANPYINIEQGAGTSLFTIDNIHYESKIPLEITNHNAKSDISIFDDVVVEFSTKLSNPSADSFKVYKPNGTIDSTCEITEKTVEFAEDGKSATISFEKDTDSHYHITIDNLTDVYGNTMSDVVEFNTMLPNLVLGTPAFYRINGEEKEALSLLTPGDVTASVSAYAFNGNDFDMLFAMGMYNKGDLVAVKTIKVPVTSEGAFPEVTLTVPDDGKFYELKTFMWDITNVKPLSDPSTLSFTTDKPIVIVKLDDLGGGTRLDTFEGVADWAREHNIKMGFGLMTYTLDSADATTKAKLKALSDDPLIEIWNHGHASDIHFSNATYEEQLADFEKAVKASSEAGINYTAFNPPWNAYSENLKNILNQYPQFKAVMITGADSGLQSKGFFDEGNSFVTLNKNITIEVGVYKKGYAEGDSKVTVVRHLEDLKTDWNSAVENGYKYVLLQSHPCHGWGTVEASDGKIYGGEGNTYYDFLLWLKEQGAVFMTPSEYAEYSLS
ncbi:MAG: hypothetical protein IJB70_02045 [Clostridia bacterium]|nr:hypothetical protein [Clostridia bacterium]